MDHSTTKDITCIVHPVDLCCQVVLPSNQSCLLEESSNKLSLVSAGSLPMLQDVQVRNIYI